jgi:hypothetical protein
VATGFEAAAQRFVVNAARNEVLTQLDAKGLGSLAAQDGLKRTKVRTLTEEEFQKFSSLGAAQAPQRMRLDDVLWRCGMLAAAGRLPQGVDPQRPSYLRHWPNLSRITPIPNGPRLAALFALKGACVMDAAALKIEQRSLVAFYNGAWALNLLTDDGSLAHRMQRKGARNRGLLTRLLGWLRR